MFRVHWFNDSSRRARAKTPGAIELPPELTGSPARIALALGNRFPMIRAHKVLAAYGCLAPRVVTGEFDPPATAQSGRRPATIAAAAWRSRAFSTAAASRCCRRT